MADDPIKTYPPQGGEPEAHAESHEAGGDDEVTGIPAAPHAASHISGGDQIQLATTVQKGLMSAANAGRIGAQALAEPNTVHVDKNRVDVYVEDGSPTFPFKTIQTGVTHAELTATSSNSMVVLIEPGTYDENIVIHEDGVHLRSRGNAQTVIVAATTGSGLTVTNATALSLGVYNTTGNYADLVNQGDAGPLVAGVWGISFLSGFANTSPPVRFLGVKGDNTATTTDFSFNTYIEHCAVLAINPATIPIYFRNINTTYIDTQSYITSTAPVTIINCNKINLSNSIIIAGVSATWNSADTAGTPANTSEKYVYGKNMKMQSLTFSGEAGGDNIFSWGVEQDVTLSGTAFLTCSESLVTRHMIVGAGCEFDLNASGVLGDITIDAAANACLMDGGDQLGTITDTGSNLTRNFSKHVDAHLTGNDQLPNATNTARGLMTTAQVTINETMDGHIHDSVDGTTKLIQANSHESVDTDSAPASIHHTVGITANQAAAGNHGHVNYLLTDGTRDMGNVGSVAGVGTVTTVGSSTLVTTTGNAFANLNLWDTITANGETQQIYEKTDNNNIVVNAAVDWSAGFAWSWVMSLHLHLKADTNDRTERGITWIDAEGHDTWQLYTWYGENDAIFGIYNAHTDVDIMTLSDVGRMSINRTFDSNPRNVDDQAPDLFSIFSQSFGVVSYTEDEAVFTDNTVEAATSEGTAFTFLNASIVDRTKNWTYLAMPRKFRACGLLFQQVGVVGWTTRVEYWNGLGWATITLIQDATSNYTKEGRLKWDRFDPGGAGDDWDETIVGGMGPYYWVRVGSTTNPPGLVDTPQMTSVNPSAVPAIGIYTAANDTIPVMSITPRGQTQIGGSPLAGNNLFQVSERIAGSAIDSATSSLASFYSQSETKNLLLQSATDLIVNPSFAVARSRGILSIPTTVQDGDGIGGLEFFGYTDDWYELSQINSYMDGVPAPGSAPTRIVFKNTPVGSTTSIERLRIAADGLISTTGTIQAGVFQGTSFNTNMAAAQLTLTGTTLGADGTDINIIINLAPKGTGSLDLGSHRISSVTDPTQAQDAATKNYSDTTFAIIAHTHATLPTVDEKANLPHIDYLKANGFISNGGLTDNGDGSVTFSNETVWLSVDDGFNQVDIYTLTGGTTGVGAIPALPYGKSYIVGKYNAGTPVFDVIIDVTLIDEFTYIPYYSIYRDADDTIHNLGWGTMGIGLSNRLHQRLVKTDRIARQSGLDLSVGAARTVLISEGIAWNGGNFSTLGAYDSTTDHTHLYYHSAGVWTGLLVTQYSNTQYDDGTNIQGLGAGKYVVNWIYRHQNEEGSTILLSDQYDTEAEAELAPIPTDVPDIISVFGLLVGGILAQQGVAAGRARSAWRAILPSDSVLDHDDTLNISGGAAGDYQHITTVQVGYLPTADQKAALVGTSGTAPSAANQLVDNTDARLSNDRVAIDHAHSGAADQSSKLVQANTHESPDTDAATSSLHHTIGTTATKAAAGNHLHTGVYPPVAHTHDGIGNNGPQLIQVNTHESPDTDITQASIHHTIEGTTPASDLGVAAAGNATKPSASNHVHKMPTSVDVGADASGTAAGLVSGHDHTGAANGPILDQSETHQNADTDVATTSLHHTIGMTATQAAAGNHTHTDFTDLKWDDLRFPVVGSTLGGSRFRIVVNLTDGGQDFRANARYIKDFLILTGQMPHTWSQGTDLHPHFHWIQNQNNIPNFLITYRIYDNGATPGAWQGPIALSSHEFTYTAGSIVQLSNFPIINASTIGLSAIIDIKLYRDTSDASGIFGATDPYSGDALLKEFDIHFQNDGRGSTLEYSK